MYQILLSISCLGDKVKKDLINNLKKKVNDLQLFERVMKLNQKDIFYIEMKKIIEVRKHSYEQWFLKKFEMIEDALLFRKKLWILENNKLRLNILKKIHDQSTLEHSGIRRTWDLIKKHFY
jgi:hypothetical protein